MSQHTLTVNGGPTVVYTLTGGRQGPPGPDLVADRAAIEAAAAAAAADALATAADRVQTGLDRVAVATDAAEVASIAGDFGDVDAAISAAQTAQGAAEAAQALAEESQSQAAASSAAAAAAQLAAEVARDEVLDFARLAEGECLSAGTQQVDLTQANRVMDYGVVYLSGPLNFAANGYARGAAAYVTIVGDGVSNVTIDSGIYSSDANVGFLKTLGVVNTLHVWADGLKVYYSFTREANPVSISVPDITPPAFVSAEVLNATPTKISIMMSESLAGPAPSAASFTVAGKTVSSASYTDEVIELTLATGVAAGDVVTVAYDGSGGIKDAANNSSPSWAAQSVTNNVGRSIVVRLTNKVTLTESGDATNGWSYIGTSAGFVNYGVCDKSLASNTDGGFSISQPTLSTANAIIALDTTSTSDAFANYDYGVYAGNASASTPYTVVRNGSASASSSGLIPAVGDTLRIRREGTVIICERQQLNAAAWDEIHRWTGATTAQLYGKLTVSSLITATNLRGDYVS